MTIIPSHLRRVGLGSLILLAFLVSLAHAQSPDKRTAESARKEAAATERIFLIGNSLTWDTVPSKLDGEVKWHVDCGKSLPYMVAHPENPCVKSSTLWPKALRDEEFGILCIQLHYGSTLAEDIEAIETLMDLQPQAHVVIHTGWARSASRRQEWQTAEANADSKMSHSLAYFGAVLSKLRQKHPNRTFARTMAMDALQQMEADLKTKHFPSDPPYRSVDDIYRDAIHMNVQTGRYLMHNVLRKALGQPIASHNSNGPTQEAATLFRQALTEPSKSICGGV